jgi:PAS domain S-box-containing protein
MRLPNEYPAILLDNISEAIVALDQEHRIVYFNKAAEEIFGYRANDIMGQPIELLLPERLAEIHRQHIRKFSGTPQNVVMMKNRPGLVARHKDGAEFPVEIGISKIAQGGEEFYAAIVVDISERKRMEEVLREREERLRLITDNVSDMITLIDLTGIRQYVSPAHTRLLGYPGEELIGKSVLSLVHPEDLHQVSAAIEEAIQTRTIQRVEFRTRHADGHYIWQEAIGKLILDRSGSPIGAVVSGRDITEHKQRQREIEAIATIATMLRAAPGRAEMMPVILHQMIQIMNLDGAALALRHGSTGDILYPLAVGDWIEWTGQREPVGVGISDQAISMRQPFVSADTANDQRIVDVERFKPVRSIMCVPLIEGGRAFGALWIGRRPPNGFINNELRWLTAIADIAANALYRAIMLETLEQRVAERTRELSDANEHLKELDRLKDRFVSNVSHELRTPLANIKLYGTLLKRGKPERFTQYLEILGRETTRLERRVEDLLELSRLDIGTATITLSLIDVNLLIEHLIADRENWITDQGMSLHVELASNLPPALSDPLRLEQVLTNLLANAVNYTPKGGAITVRTGLRAEDRLQWVTFTVEDTGPGIAAEEVPHLFERFYRGTVGRKSGTSGSGLGLAICKELIDRLGGRITVDSEPGHGARFSVWLKT